MQVRLTTLADDLRAAGLTVVELDGWKTRSRPESAGGFDPVGVLWHHTGDDADGKRYAEWLANVGRPDLPPPLVQLSIDREGVVYVCAAGRCNHAGEAKASGSVAAGDGNTLYCGVEVQNTGTEGYPAAQYAAMVTVGAVLGTKTIKCTVNAQRAHYETSVTGKWDPGDPEGLPFNGKRVLDMAAFRAAIAAAMKPPRHLFRVQHRIVTANMFTRNPARGSIVSGPVEGIGRIVARVVKALGMQPDAIAAQEGQFMLSKLEEVDGYNLFDARSDGEASKEIPVLLHAKRQCLGTEYHHAANGTGTGALDHARGIFVVKYVKRGSRCAVVNTHMGLFADEADLESGKRKPGPAALQHAEHAQQVVRIVKRLRANGYTVHVTADANARGIWSQSLPAVLAAAGMRVTRNSVDLIASDPGRVRFKQQVLIAKEQTGSDAHDALAIRTIEKRKP